MPAPVLTTFGQRLYDELAPLAYDDANQGYSLANFCAAIAKMFDQAQSYIEGDGTRGPFVDAMNPDKTPVDLIPWLAQFVGVHIITGTPSANWRTILKNVGGFKRGTPAAIVQGIKTFLTGTQSVWLTERRGSAWRFSVATLASETPVANIAAINNVIANNKPAGIMYPDGIVQLASTNDYNAVKYGWSNYSKITANRATYAALLASPMPPSA